MKKSVKSVAEAGGAILLSNVKDQFVGGYASPVADAIMAVIAHSAIKGDDGNVAAAFFGAKAVTNAIKRIAVKNPSSLVGRVLPGEIGGGLFQLKVGSVGTSGLFGLNASGMMDDPYMIDQLGSANMSGGMSELDQLG